ncbi:MULTISPECIES: ATP-binding protein [unclassified Streptomyces]|uniref:ATP-binding protein n=1 Tax=unclassified Streptomyces TaxID=2593676 RepID=UPI002877E6E2|nr:ATP-binding protein [Streptomyces sp. BB1-1-1]WND33254.1 ATP-binding protein [Streptomyces sp. BB1-1-1]
MNDTCELADCQDVCGSRAVRDGVRDQLDRWGSGALAPDAELVVTELLSNALRHGRPPVRVALTVLCAPRGRSSVRVEVTDSGAAFDVGLVRARWRHPSFRVGETGRGLFLVDALCSRWGDRPAEGGHTVWADLC